VEVYNLYLLGRHAWNNITVDSCRDAAAYFTRAVALDPDFAEPHAGLVDVYTWLMFLELRRPTEVMALSKRMALLAIQLDECCAEGYVALGTLTGLLEWQWEEGERLNRLGLELRPSSLSAHVQAAFTQIQRGNLRAARETLQKSHELDPLSVRVHRAAAVFHYHAREYETALESAERARELGPDVPDTRYFLGMVLLQLGRYEEAIAELELGGGGSFRGQIQGTLAMAYAAAERPDEANKALDRLTALAQREYVSPAGFVYAWLAVGDKGRALAALNEALEERTAGFMSLLLDPRVDPLRDTEDFQRVLRRMNLV
jgi:tetratricopeptide (TPR) repeat protein